MYLNRFVICEHEEQVTVPCESVGDENMYLTPNMNEEKNDEDKTTEIAPCNILLDLLSAALRWKLLVR